MKKISLLTSFICGFMMLQLVTFTAQAQNCTDMSITATVQTHATCPSNGVIKVVISGTGILLDPVEESNRPQITLIPQSSGQFVDWYTLDGTGNTKYFNNAFAGVYTVKVRAFCSTMTDWVEASASTAATVLDQYPNFTFSAGASRKTMSCRHTGGITLTIAGGQKPYTVALVAGQYPSAYPAGRKATTPYQLTSANATTTDTISNIPAGNYTFQVTDNCGSIRTFTATVTTLTQDVPMNESGGNNMLYNTLARQYSNYSDLSQYSMYNGTFTPNDCQTVVQYLYFNPQTDWTYFWQNSAEYYEWAYGINNVHPSYYVPVKNGEPSGKYLNYILPDPYDVFCSSGKTVQSYMRPIGCNHDPSQARSIQNNLNYVCPPVNSSTPFTNQSVGNYTLDGDDCNTAKLHCGLFGYYGLCYPVNWQVAPLSDLTNILQSGTIPAPAMIQYPNISNINTSLNYPRDVAYRITVTDALGKTYILGWHPPAGGGQTFTSTSTTWYNAEPQNCRTQYFYIYSQLNVPIEEGTKIKYVSGPMTLGMGAPGAEYIVPPGRTGSNARYFYPTSVDPYTSSKWIFPLAGRYIFEVTNNCNITQTSTWTVSQHYEYDELVYTDTRTCDGLEIKPSGLIYNYDYNSSTGVTTGPTAAPTYYRIVSGPAGVTFNPAHVGQGGTLVLPYPGTYVIGMTYRASHNDTYICDQTRTTIVFSNEGILPDPDYTIGYRCAGDTYGQIFVKAMNGVPPYTYSITAPWEDRSSSPFVQHPPTSVQTNTTGNFYWTGLVGQTYDVVVTDFCNNSATLKVSVFPIENANIAYPEFGSYCVGDPIQLNCVTLGDAASYNWTGPNGYSANISKPRPIATYTNPPPAGYGNGGSYQLEVTPTNCATSTIKSLNVQVSGAITATPIITGPSSICIGAGVTATYEVVPPVAGASEYTWTFPAGWTPQTATTTAPVITVTPPNGVAAAAPVKVAAKNSCSTSSEGQLMVTLSTGSGVAQPGTITGPIMVCLTVSGNVTFSIEPVTGATGYLWVYPANWTYVSGQGTTTLTLTSPTYTLPPLPMSVIEVRAVGSCGNGPARTTMVILDSGVPGNPNPITSLIPTSVCTGSGPYTFSTTPVSGSPSYQWSVPEGWTIESGQGTTTITVSPGLDAENGFIELKTQSGCGTSIGKASFEVTIPSITIMSHPSNVAPTALCTGTDKFPELSVSASGEDLSFQWYRNTSNSNIGGEIILGADTDTYSPSINGLTAGLYFYYAVVTDRCGTSKASLTSGIHEVKDCAPSRYLVALESAPTDIISEHYWLADAVAQVNTLRAGSSTPYIIYATMDDDDVINTGGDVAHVKESVWTDNTAVAIPAGMVVTLTSFPDALTTAGADAFVIKQPGSARHLNVSGNLTLTNIVIDGDNVANNGGGISGVSGSVINVTTGAIIRNNSTDTDGGGINTAGNVTVSGGIIAGNQAAVNGGGIWLSGTITVSGGIISGNRADGITNSSYGGGGIYSTNNSATAVQITGGRIGGTSTLAATTNTPSTDTAIGNFAANSGGGVCSGNGKITMSAGTISYNRANSSTVDYGDGGGIKTLGEFEMLGGSIEWNRAGRQGGGVSSSNSFTLKGTGTIAGNYSAFYGGGIYAGGGSIFIEGGVISGNKCNNGYGGGIAYNGTGTFKITGGRIGGTSTEASSANTPSTDPEIGNLSGMGGGGIYTGQTSSVLIIEGSATKYITYNRANAAGGGGIQIIGSSTPLNLTNTGSLYITNNSTNSEGGGIRASSIVTIADPLVTISNNTTATYGGGLYTLAGFNMSAGTISNNTANHGGGISHAGGVQTGVITGGTISGNTASNNGGGIHCSNSTTLTVSGNPQIINNTATNGDGGGIFTFDHTKLTVTGGTFNGNTAVRKVPWMTTSPYWAAINTVYQAQCGSFVPTTTNISNLGSPDELAGVGTSPTYNNLYNNYDINITVNSLTFNDNKPTPSTVTYYYFPNTNGTVLDYTTLFGADSKFKKWNTEAEGGGTDYDPNDPITMNGDITLYAQRDNEPETYEIWNWADLAYLNVLIDNENSSPKVSPKLSDYDSYVLMQNLGHPSDAASYGDGLHGGATNNVPCPYDGGTGPRILGCYGYENWNGTNYLTDGSSLLVGHPGIALGRNAWDITAPGTGQGWIPIGVHFFSAGSPNPNSKPFSNIFKGRDCSISGLWINRPAVTPLTNNKAQGLFGFISDASIDSLKVNISPTKNIVGMNANIGGLVGYVNGVTTINACSVTGKILGGGSKVGGLIGSIGPELPADNTPVKIIKCYSSVELNIPGATYVAGLIGFIQNLGTEVINCHATGSVTAGSGLGGLIGQLSGIRLENSSASGNINATGVWSGGLVGIVSSQQFPFNIEIKNCYATGDVTSTTIHIQTWIGGLVGVLQGADLKSCFATGNVDASSGGGIGGLIGRLDGGGSVSNSYATGNVIGYNYIGGVVGEYNIANSRLMNCYATGSVESLHVNSMVGGVVGVGSMPTALTPIYITNCFGLNSYIRSHPDAVNNPTTSGVGRVLGWAFGGLQSACILTNNYGMKETAVYGQLVGTIPGHTQYFFYNGKDSLSACDLTNKTDGANPFKSSSFGDWGTDFDNYWTYNYLGNNINVATGTNLPVLKAFTTTDFPTAVQNPKAPECGKIYEIWNWADLAYINTLITNEENNTGAANQRWGYYSKFVLMQNLGRPDDPSSYGDGLHGGATNNVLCPYDGGTGPRILGCYGYENWISGGFTQGLIPTTNTMNVGMGLGTIQTAWNSGGWIPIGFYRATNQFYYYPGDFNGNNKVIRGLWINRSSASNYQGLFVNAGLDSKIYDLKLILDQRGITANGDRIGSLLGYAFPNSTIDNCSMSGNVTNTGNGSTGGLIGWSQGAISSCYSTGVVSGGITVGGLIGSINGGSVTNCYSTCNVSGFYGLGGLVGASSGSEGWPVQFVNCYATGNVQANSNHNIGGVGGFIGRTESAYTFTSCYATGNVQGGDIHVGGFAGNLRSSTMTNCYATGNVTGDNNVGGLVGNMLWIDRDVLMDPRIEYCFATGSVNGGENVGGLVGNSCDEATIINSFALNPEIISSTAINIGRVLGNKAALAQLINNRALACMKVKGVEITTGQLNNINGLNVQINDVTSQTSHYSGWSFGGATPAWTFTYNPNYAVATSPPTNLPILTAFTKTAFPAAIQPPVAECLNTTYEIWNWADLAYIQTLINNQENPFFTGPANQKWSYYTKFVLMQDLGVPLQNNSGNGTGADGIASTADDCPYPYPRNQGWYGYQNWITDVSFNNTQILTTNTLDVGMGLGTITYQPYELAWGVYGWSPIGKPKRIFEAYYYPGEFDGNNKVISGLWINSIDGLLGLFMNAGLDSKIYNLGLNLDQRGVTGHGENVAGLIGYVFRNTTITNCYVNGKVTNTGVCCTGGLTGWSHGTISSCYSTGEINGVAGTGGLIGGTNGGEVTNCYSTCKVTGYFGVGGLVGTGEVGEGWPVQFTNCYATGDVQGSFYDPLGGIGGFIGNTDNGYVFTSCYATGNVQGDLAVGGFAGHLNSSTMTNCYATGNVTGEENVGGLAGDMQFYSRITRMDPLIENCFATGIIKGDENVGGLVGKSCNEATIKNSFALNPEIKLSPANNIGRVLGNKATLTQLINNHALSCMKFLGDTFSDIDPTSVHGADILLEDVVQPKQLTYTGKGWNFTDVWTFNYTDYNVTTATNLPILQAFNINDNNGYFANAVQPPFAECQTRNYEIWNWADLAYINTLIYNDENYDPSIPDEQLWSYYDKFVLMQNLGHPNVPTSYGDGLHGGATNNVLCPYPQADRKLGCYGYQNWRGTTLDGAFNATAGYYPTLATNKMLVGIDEWELLKGWDANGWMPIGIPHPYYSQITTYYPGEFDGNKKVINNLWINNTSASDLGLFMNIGKESHIYNLGINLDQKGIKGDSRVAGLVGFISSQDSKITNCYVNGSVSGTGSSVGGLIGYNWLGQIESCYTTGVVSGDYHVGGLIGYHNNEGSMTDSYSTSTVSGTGAVGGLIGGGGEAGNGSDIINCYATGNVTGTGDNVGGFAGWAGDRYKMTSCYATGNVIGNDEVGGFAGTCYYVSTMTNCYATGNVSGNQYVGGLAGNLRNSSIIYCFASGTVSGYDYVYGLSYTNSDYWVGGSIQNSYALNPSIKATAQNATIGRISVTNPANLLYLANNYALSCMLVNGATVSSTNAASIQGADILLENVVQPNVLTYTGNDWDFTDVWTFDYTDYNVTTGTNLPILQAFNINDNNGYFANAVQPPFASIIPLIASVTIEANPTGAICEGTQVTFTATPTNGGSNPTYQWKINGDNVGTNSTTYQSSTLADGDKLTCVLTSNRPCVEDITVESNEITMTVDEKVQPSFNFGKTLDYCVGEANPETLPTTSNNNITGHWERPLGTTVTTIQTATQTTTPDIYTFIPNANQCVSSTNTTLEVTIDDNVTPSVAIETDTEHTICTGTTVTFTATPTNGGDNPAYQWKVNGGNVGTNSDTYSSSTLANGAIVTCVMTSDHPCALPTTATSNSITITVTSTAPLQPGAITGDNELCMNETDQYPYYTYSITPVTGATNYSWTFSDPNWMITSPTDDGNVITVDVSSSAFGDEVTIYVKANNVCGSSPAATMKAKLVKCWSVYYDPNYGGSPRIPKTFKTYTPSDCYTVLAPEDVPPIMPPPGKPLFLGWNTQSDGTGTMYQPDDDICDIDENIILYAIWGVATCAGELIGAIHIIDPPTCDGITTGSIRVDIIGGSGNFEYTLNDNTPEPFTGYNLIITDLIAGNYTVTLYDVDNDCEDVSPTLALLGKEALTKATNITTTSPTNCNGTGTFSATIQGIPNYSYIIKGITDPAFNHNSTPQTGTTLTHTSPLLPTGQYTLTIIDINGCQAPAGKFTINPTNFSTTYNINVTAGDCDTENTLTITLTNNTDPYYFNINGTGWFEIPDGEAQITLPAGNHTIRLKDENNCISKLENIPVNPINTNAFNVTVDAITTTKCGLDNGTITVKVAQPGTYNYRLTTTITGTFTVAANGTHTITNIPAGIYHIAINNDNGTIVAPDCPYFYTIYNTEVPQGLDYGTIAAPSALSPQTFCDGATIANLQADGINLKWYNAANTLQPPNTPLTNGIYHVTQTTNEGCQSEHTNVTVIINNQTIIDAPYIPYETYLCQPATLAQIPTNGNTNIVWYNQMVGGTKIPLNTQLEDGDIYYAAIEYGNAACQSIQRTEVNIIITTPENIPQPQIESPQHFCEGALISNIKTTTNNILWYWEANSNEPITPDTKLINHTYYAAQKAGNCQSTQRTPVQTIIDQYPPPFAPQKQSTCNKTLYLSDLMVSGIAIKWYTQPNGNNQITNPETTIATATTTYYAAQTTADCEGQRTPIQIVDDCYSPYGTIFPFVRTGDTEFDQQFITTAKLYTRIPANITDKIGYLRTQTPVQTVVVEYYDCTGPSIVGAPKNPGYQGRTNNPGLPINWIDKGITNPGTVNTATLTLYDKCPLAPIGKYQFTDVAPDTYIIEIARKGFLPRYGKITIQNNEYLGHRELLGGDLTADLVINEKDLSTFATKKGSYNMNPAAYNWLYDLNGDKAVDGNDQFIININLGAQSTIYAETIHWFNNP